jgi:hypothetical protein
MRMTLTFAWAICEFAPRRQSVCPMELRRGVAALCALTRVRAYRLCFCVGGAKENDSLSFVLALILRKIGEGGLEGHEME